MLSLPMSVAVAALWLAGAPTVVVGLLNSTSVLYRSDGFVVYPCLQLNHRLAELEPSMMGLWYAIEVVQHRPESKRGNAHAPVCPKLTLYQPNNRTVKLTWAEKEGDAVYTYERVDVENPGFWMSYSSTTGSTLNPVHKQFAGSTQVIEARHDRLVLTFCEHSQHHRQHFSVIAVRNVTSAAAPHDTADSHRLMRDLGLPEDSVRRTCEPGSLWERGRASPSSVLSAALLVACALLSASR